MTQPAPSAGRRIAFRLALAALAAAGALLMAGRLASGVLEALASPWTLHATVALAAACGALALLRRWRTFAVGACLLLWGAAAVLPALRPQPATDASSAVRVAAANVLGSAPVDAGTIDWFVEQEADIVAFVEFTPGWDAAMRARPRGEGIARWPHALTRPESMNLGGVGLFSRWPIREGSIELGPGEGFWNIDAVVETPIGEVRVLVIHPVPPIGRSATQRRDADLAWIAQRCAQRSMPTIVLGDWNETPFGAAYARFIASTGFAPVRGDALGITPTWPRNFHGWSVPGWMGIQIDHAFTSPQLAAGPMRAGRPAHSDHAPLCFGVGRAPVPVAPP